MPFPMSTKSRSLPTQRLLKLEFGFATAERSNAFQGDNEPEDTETMITGDLNTALVPWVVQYRITDPKTYLFGAREPETNSARSFGKCDAGSDRRSHGRRSPDHRPA